MRKFVLSAMLFCLLAITAAAGETAYEEGIKLLRLDKPNEARLKFEDALLRDSRNEDIYLNLGVVYQKLDNPSKAIDVLQNGLLVATAKKNLIYFNIGNCYFDMGDNTLAEKNYTLSIAEDKLFADAYLNRAQARIRLVLFKECIDDYKTYLRLKPDALQRKKIEKLLAVLEGDLQDQEKILQNILNSIKNASSDTQTTSAGTEGFKDTGSKDVDILD